MNAAQKGINARNSANSAISASNSNATAIGIIAGILGFDSITTLLTAGATVGLGATVAGLTTTVTAHSTTLLAINNTIQYVNTGLLTESIYTKFISDIRISSFLSQSPDNANIFLSLKASVASFF